MPGVDWIPGVSQLKSLVQVVTLDFDGAAQTQANFFQECPVVAQAVSVGQLVTGDVDGFVETNKKSIGTINNVANGIPVVGHTKGLVHHALGDHKGGNAALNAATRSTVVIGTGVVTGIATGGLAAIPAGIAAGAGYDAVDSAISDRPKGLYAAIDHAANNPSGGTIFDTAAVVVGDGMAGYAGGQIGKNVVNQIKAGNASKAQASSSNAEGASGSSSVSGGGGSGGGNSLSAAKQAELSHLEALREIKYEKLDSAMFPEKGPIMAEGDVLKLSREIDVITNKIQAISPSKPAPGPVHVKQSGGGGAQVPVVSGNFSTTNNKSHDQKGQQQQKKKQSSGSSTGQSSGSGQNDPPRRARQQTGHEWDVDYLESFEDPIYAIEIDAQTGLVQRVHACIRHRHLRQGVRNRIPGAVRARFRREGLLKGDHVGHIIADVLGGTTGDHRHYFPQSPNCNWEQYHQVERRIKEFLERHREGARVEVEFRLDYAPYMEHWPPNRPRQIVVEVIFHDGTGGVTRETFGPFSNA